MIRHALSLDMDAFQDGLLNAINAGDYEAVLEHATASVSSEYAESMIFKRNKAWLPGKHQGNPLYFGFTRGAIIVRGWRCCWRDMRFF